MPVSSSTVAVDPFAQIDGRYWIRETHVLDDGAEITAEYLGDPKQADAVAAERAVQIDAQVKEQDIAANAAKPVDEWDVKQANRADVVAYLRKQYDNAVGVEAAKLAVIIVGLSDEDIALAWEGVKPADVRAKAQAQADDYAKVLAIKGDAVDVAAVAVVAVP